MSGIRRSTGRLFHTTGLLTEKLRSPRFAWCVEHVAGTHVLCNLRTFISSLSLKRWGRIASLRGDRMMARGVRMCLWSLCERCYVTPVYTGQRRRGSAAAPRSTHLSPVVGTLIKTTAVILLRDFRSVRPTDVVRPPTYVTCRRPHTNRSSSSDDILRLATNSRWTYSPSTALD